ncbi:hypothetical protein TPA0910_18570 [Streptomyces hygroscopicus subsp. sporocinereus]|uniref:Uncharacterized protein n=1 Tax=Streptomyces hygroscopicus TaxID=1912 RepID=A0ABQ3TVR0_STRHY|nr:hypothetical protein TPA0910_18570 [Streptomyces hygroscopicus]
MHATQAAEWTAAGAPLPGSGRNIHPARRFSRAQVAQEVVDHAPGPLAPVAGASLALGNRSTTGSGTVAYAVGFKSFKSCAGARG